MGTHEVIRSPVKSCRERKSLFIQNRTSFVRRLDDLQWTVGLIGVNTKAKFAKKAAVVDAVMHDTNTHSRPQPSLGKGTAIFKKIQSAPDPRAAWRKYLGVWPDCNVNGQFVTYDVKPGETLKVWRGEASSQGKANFPDRYLEGGWEKIIFHIERSDARNDVMRYYKLNGGKGNQLQGAISQEDFDKLSREQKSGYTEIREKISHPNISGPFETGWGYTDFGGVGFLEKIGLPSLPGQTTTLAK
ncbi:MAG: hypothetical protein JWM42_3835 [Burkholderia sp.]|nr:hypothetical protein [Burkholderia sp.]